MYEFGSKSRPKNNLLNRYYETYVENQTLRTPTAELERQLSKRSDELNVATAQKQELKETVIESATSKVFHSG